MSYATGRIMLFDRDGAPLGDIDPDHLLAPPRMVEEVNGEHSLTIRTTDTIAPGTRALWQDGMGKWHEWVYDEPEEQHRENTYVLVWSLQADLEMTGGRTHWASAEIGTHDPVGARAALEAALSDQSRWEVGTVDVTSTGGASLYDAQAWDYLRKVVEVWGGELSATITVGDVGVIKREVNLLTHVGATTATRRFDYGHDVTDIKRTPEPAPYYCRVRPRGGNAKTDNDGVDYSDRVGIEDWTPNGEDYLEDSEAALVFRVKNPDGSYEYPTKDVNYTVAQTSLGPDDEELYYKAIDDLHNHTRPKVTYEANVLQFARAGLDYQGIAEGDNIQIVDRCFSADGTPLRIEGRVLRIEQDIDLFGGKSGDMRLTIGNLGTTLAETIINLTSSTTASIEQRLNEVVAGGTIVYLQNLLDAINAELNVTGGYYYLVPGHGIYTYDHAVSDPLVGTEASQVVQIVGGGIRIANSRTQAGDWDWKTVIVSGHIAAGLVTAANITAGYIGDALAGSYWDLDNGNLRIAASASIGGSTVSDVLDDITDAAKVATNYLTFSSSNGLEVGYTGTNAKTRINSNGMEVFDGAGNSSLYAGLSGNDSIVRVGQASGSGNVVMSSQGYVDIRRNSEVIAHFGYSTYVYNNVQYSGAIYTLGTRTDGIFAANSIVGGTDNRASQGSENTATFGKGLIAANEGGLAIGKYNVGGSGAMGYHAHLPLLYPNTPGQHVAMFVIGYGSSSNRKNILEVDHQGNLALAGSLQAPNVGTVVETTFSSVSVQQSSSIYYKMCEITLPSSGTWMVFANVSMEVYPAGAAQTSILVNTGSSTTICRSSTTVGKASASGVYVDTAGTTNSKTVKLSVCNNTSGTYASGSLQAVRIK